MRKDDILLNEAYRKVHTDDLQQLDELFGNVADARLKGVGATIGGLKNRVVGNIQKGVGGLQAAYGNQEKGIQNIQSGQAKVQSSKDAGTNAKIDSILNSQGQDIRNLSTKIVNQLNKLGLGGSASVDELSKAMNSKLQEVVKKQAPVSATTTPTAATTTPTAATTSTPATTTPEATPKPTDEELGSEAGEALTKDEAAKREEQRKATMARMTGKTADSETTEEAPAEEIPAKADAETVKKNAAIARTGNKASGFKAFSSKEEAPVNVPDNSEVKDKKGNTYRYEPEEKQWVRMLKTGNYEFISHPEDQKLITQAWQKQQNKPKEAPPEPKRANLEFESFKSFWNKN